MSSLPEVEALFGSPGSSCPRHPDSVKRRMDSATSALIGRKEGVVREGIIDLED
jgi:hypothetical protein